MYETYRHHKFQHSPYMKKSIRTKELKSCIRLAIRALKHWKFDTIAFRGISGALLSAPIALALNKNMIIVRKPSDSSHSVTQYHHKVEGNANARSYIIVDDFVSSGTTMETIQEEVKKFAPKAKFIGLLEVHRITEAKLKKYRGKKYPLTKHLGVTVG